MILCWYYGFMPRKIRQLIEDLKRAGFAKRGGKGSHRIFTHPQGQMIVLSGNLGHDAKRYQELAVAAAVREAGDETK